MKLHGTTVNRRTAVKESVDEEEPLLNFVVFANFLNVAAISLLLLLLFLFRFIRMDVHLGPDGVFITDLTVVSVTSFQQITGILRENVNRNRSVGATNINEHSSRSHWYALICSS